MALKLLTILSFFAVSNLVVGQVPQTPEEVQLCKQRKIKSVRASRINYAGWASSPEGQISSTDTSTSFRLFDTTGKLVREYAGSGTNYRRDIYYDTNGRIDNELWLWSKLQVYPEFSKPNADSDYTNI
jgi:hypothetical protein